MFVQRIGCELTSSSSNFQLLTALNECTEWGQVFILDSLSNYSPADSKEAQSITERITPRLQHANAAVVLSAVKVLMKYMEVRPIFFTYNHYFGFLLFSLNSNCKHYLE